MLKNKYWRTPLQSIIGDTNYCLLKINYLRSSYSRLLWAIIVSLQDELENNFLCKRLLVAHTAVQWCVGQITAICAAVNRRWELFLACRWHVPQRTWMDLICLATGIACDCLNRAMGRLSLTNLKVSNSKNPSRLVRQTAFKNEKNGHKMCTVIQIWLVPSLGCIKFRPALSIYVIILKIRHVSDFYNLN